MQIAKIVLLACGTALAQAADLHCLAVAWWNPVIGLICHFKPKVYSGAENATITEVENAVEAGKDLVKFDLTYNPVSVAYRFINSTRSQGLKSGRAELTDAGRAYKDLTIGFTKEGINTGYQIYEIAFWGDVTRCLIYGSVKLVATKKRRVKRIGTPSLSETKDLAERCASEKIERITGPAIFNLNGTNQNVGATVFDVGSLFVPVAPEEGIAKATEGAVDLALVGSEDTIRIYKKVGDAEIPAAEHFASEAEAESVAQNIGDEKWYDENCGTCSTTGSSAGAVAGGIATSKRRRRALPSIYRRGNVFGSCCKVPAVVGPSSSSESTFENPFASPDIPLEDFDPEVMESNIEKDGKEVPKANFFIFDQKAFDAANYAKLVEGDLVPPPDYTTWGLEDAEVIPKIQNDLIEYNSAVVEWSAEMKQSVVSSDELFSQLRKTFTGPRSDELYKQLEIYSRNGPNRMATFSHEWIDKTSPALKQMKDFVNAAVKHGVNVVGKLKGLTTEEAAAKYSGNVEFFWSGPGDAALKGVDPRGLHVDGGLMQFGAADTPGLVIRNTAKDSMARVRVEKDSLQLLKASNWDLDGDLAGKPNAGATPHGVFGPEMAEKGRVSMVMSIFNK